MKPGTRHVEAGQPVALTAAWNGLRRYVEACDFVGYDPYDALNSPLLRAFSLGTEWGRIALIQALKHCPVNLRPLLAVGKGHNPKALALLLEGYAKMAATPQSAEALGSMRRLIRLLEASRTRTLSGHGWGYNFDWQSRAFFVPKYTPSIVCSAFVGHALLDTYQRTGNESALELAIPVGDFFVRDLNRMEEGDNFCFSYTQLDHYAVHNANLLGASLLVRLGSLTGRPEFTDEAMRATRYSLKHQHDDGSWYYSERAGSQWIDSFHTGFNLEAIRWFRKFGTSSGLEDAYRAGLAFYAGSFFLADGTPKYYSNRLYPIDIHSAAEAIAFFSLEGPEYRPLASRILTWTLSNMRNTNGSFAYRQGQLLTVRIPYMRWSQAWMFRALAAYLYSNLRAGAVEAPSAASGVAFARV